MTFLLRYTNLAATINLLCTRAISLLNPGSWDDRNDSYFMAEYKRKTGVNTLLALCFAECSQTYHHWKVFSHGSDGVCIEFDKAELLSTFLLDPNVSFSNVQYMKIKDLSTVSNIPIGSLPFLKREPYEAENEFRIIYTDAKLSRESAEFPIQISWINRVTLSPWMPVALWKSVTKTLKSIDGCSKLKISRSTLVENENWKKLTSKVR